MRILVSIPLMLGLSLALTGGCHLEPKPNDEMTLLNVRRVKIIPARYPGVAIGFDVLIEEDSHTQTSKIHLYTTQQAPSIFYDANPGAPRKVHLSQQSNRLGPRISIHLEPGESAF